MHFSFKVTITYAALIYRTLSIFLFDIDFISTVTTAIIHRMKWITIRLLDFLIIKKGGKNMKRRLSYWEENDFLLNKIILPNNLKKIVWINVLVCLFFEKIYEYWILRLYLLDRLSNLWILNIEDNTCSIDLVDLIDIEDIAKLSI